MVLNFGVGETLESLFDCKEIQPVNPKGNQSWIFIGRTDAEAEAPILGHLMFHIWLIRKDADVGKDWRQEEKGTTEDETVGWHHWLDRHECEQAPGVGDGHGSLACCSPWGCKETDTTERLNWTEETMGGRREYMERCLQTLLLEMWGVWLWCGINNLTSLFPLPLAFIGWS